MRILMKFGGSSLATIDLMKKACERIIEKRKTYDEVVVVVSAMGKTTNKLLSLAKEASKYPNKRDLDMLIATGEIVSSSLLSMMLEGSGVKAIALTGGQAGIQTIGQHTNNKITNIDILNVEKQLELGNVVVVAGFQGLNSIGETTTLGRGGSDITAIALGAKLKCLVEIYTDVTGIYGVDPSIYKDAKQLLEIDYEEMKEMAFLGAKVMEPRSIDIAQQHGVEILVRSHNGNNQGTYIKERKDIMEQKRITGIAVSEKVVMISIRNIPYDTKITASLFVALAKNNINIDVINQNPGTKGFMNLAFTANADDIDEVNEVLDKFKTEYPKAQVLNETDIVKVSLVGSAMRTESGIAAEAFSFLAQNNFDFKLVTTSEISISYTFNKKDKDAVVLQLATHFNL